MVTRYCKRKLKPVATATGCHEFWKDKKHNRYRVEFEEIAVGTYNNLLNNENYKIFSQMNKKQKLQTVADWLGTLLEKEEMGDLQDAFVHWCENDRNPKPGQDIINQGYGPLGCVLVALMEDDGKFN